MPTIFLSFNRSARAHYYGDKALAGLRALGEVRLNDSDCRARRRRADRRRARLPGDRQRPPDTG